MNDSDDSEDTDEDEYGQDLTPEVDAQILRTIAAIRNKDSRIYDPKADFFDGKMPQNIFSLFIKFQPPN